ncbi:MAG: beta-glucosidase [Armatimonadetes bacterium]|nr:beta-glucosidase [Armatimonadota bacterium]
MSGFPNDFVWGAATAAYQIEGSHDADGKGPSVWDEFCRRPGAVFQGHTGDQACDHVHRFRDDVALMRGLGLQGYRFSVSWPRVVPEGRGTVNVRGLEFYDKLVDELLEAGIRPYATLFHWDYPYSLFLEGGWWNPDSPRWFAEYASVVARRLADRVQDWFTLNEPGIFLVLGHVEGSHAPGVRGSAYEFFLALKQALLAHGLGVQAVRAASGPDCRVSYAPHCVVGVPATEDPADVEAARSYTFGDSNNGRKFWQQRLLLDPVLKGEWPEDIESALSHRSVGVTAEDLDTMHRPLDYLGLNYYSGELVRAGADGRPETVPDPPGMPRTLFDWPVRPEGLYWTLRFHTERYGLPMMVTENGLSNMDWVSEDGAVHDPQRTEFLRRYLRQARRAIGDGSDVLGYLHWSLLDNFEWADGYRQRFGLVHVDYATQKRTVKDSARWFSEVIATNGASLG